MDYKTDRNFKAPDNCPTVKEFWDSVRKDKRIPQGEYVGRMGLYHLMIGILRSRIDTDENGEHIPDDSKWLKFLRDTLLSEAEDIQKELKSRGIELSELNGYCDTTKGTK